MGAYEKARSAKHPATTIAGPYGHPLHPALVTVPIGAWVASFVFDIASVVDDDRAGAFGTGAYWLIALGVLGAVVAAIWGLMDLMTIPRQTKAFRTGILHMSLNLLVAAAFVGSFLIRLDTGYERQTPGGLIALSGVTLAVLGFSGWLGGRLAYRFGVRVAEESVQVDGFVSDVGPSPGTTASRAS